MAKLYLAEDSELVVPGIHPRWSCERLCVMDYLPGPTIGQWLREGRANGVDARALAARGADAVLKMVFVDGCFHADPHPGNVILVPDGRTGLVDFGMVGFLSEERRLEFLDLLVAVATHRVDDVVEILSGWSDAEVDHDLLTQDSGAFLDRYYGASLAQIDVGALLADLTGLLRENDLFLPGDVALLLKVFVTLEGLGRAIDPDFVMAEHIEPFARAAWRQRRSPIALVRRGAGEIGALLGSLPRDLRKLAREARRGRIRVEVDVQRLEPFGQRVTKAVNRLTMGLVTAALIVGTSIALNVRGPGPNVLGMPLFGALGFTSSLALGVWLLWSILRSGRS